MSEPKTITVTRTISIVFEVSEVAKRFREDNDEKPDFDDIMDMIISESDDYFQETEGEGECKFTDEEGNLLDMVVYGYAT